MDLFLGGYFNCRRETVGERGKVVPLTSLPLCQWRAGLPSQCVQLLGLNNLDVGQPTQYCLFC